VLQRSGPKCQWGHHHFPPQATARKQNEEGSQVAPWSRDCVLPRALGAPETAEALVAAYLFRVRALACLSRMTQHAMDLFLCGARFARRPARWSRRPNIVRSATEIRASLGSTGDAFHGVHVYFYALCSCRLYARRSSHKGLRGAAWRDEDMDPFYP
jgi:hypothetical protein